MPPNIRHHRNSSLSEALAESFAAWEVSGRGWQIFDYETCIEPSFSKFMPPVRVGRPIDDGRVPRLFGRFFTKNENTNPISNGEVPPASDSNRLQPQQSLPAATASVRLYLPKEMKTYPEQIQQFLLSVSSSVSFIAFEIIGTNREIIFQISCPAQDKDTAFSQLKNHFPGLEVRETEDALRENLPINKVNQGVMVDFGLGREWFIPIPFGKSFATDPLIPLVACFDELRGGETGCLQILLTRTHSNWQGAAQDAIFDRNGKLIFANLQNSLSAIREKLSNPLLAVCVKFIAQSDSREQSLRITRRTGAFFKQFSSPHINELIPLRNEGMDANKHLQSFFRRTSFRTGLLLSAQELSAVVHLPSDAVQSEKLKREQNRTNPAPEFATRGNLVLGENEHLGQKQIIKISDEQRLKHLFLLGASGSGKTTAILNCVKQDMKLGNGVCVIDPHDLINDILARVPEHRLKDVVLFDPADSEFPVGFNILSAHSELERNLLSSDLVSIFQKFSTSWGDIISTLLHNAVLAFLSSTTGGTLVDLKYFLTDKDFRSEFLKTVADEDIRYYWQREFPAMGGKPHAPLLMRLDLFLRSKLIRHIVAQKDNKLDFRRIMDERKILLVKLTHGSIGSENSNLLASLVIAKVYQAAVSRQNVSAANRPPFFIYLDEAHHYFHVPSVALLLSEGRKFGISLLASMQDIQQIARRDNDILSSLMTNCYTRICFRSDTDAEKLARGFSFFTADHLKNLGVGECLVRFEQSRFDFNLKTSPLEPVAPEVARKRRTAIIEHTRRTYATPKAEIEEILKSKRFVRTTVRIENYENINAIEETVLPTGSPTIHKEISDLDSQVVQPPIEIAESVAPTLPKVLPATKPTQSHRYLQSLVKRMAESRGFLVIIEKEVFGGAGKIDVALENDTRKIAVEISVTNEAEYELRNIRKCLTAGYSPVVVIAVNARHLDKIKRKAAADLSTDDLSRIEFLTPDEFHNWLENLETENSESEQRVKGFRVKVKLKPVEEKSRSTRQKAISEVVFGGLKKLKKDDRKD